MTPGPGPNTTSRFALLAVTATVTAYFLHGLTLTALSAAFDLPWGDLSGGCVDGVRHEGVPPGEFAADFRVCLYRAGVLNVLVRLGLVVVTFGVAAALYLRHSRARWPLTSLDAVAATDGQAVEHVRDVLAEHGDVEATVLFRLNQTGAEGRTYGLPGSYRVELSDALLEGEPGSPERDLKRLRGVLRHELAHLRNRDVGVTQLTIALRRSVLGTAALPALLAWTTRPQSPAILLAVALSAALLWLEYAAVLRAREYHADAAVQDPDFVQVLRDMEKARPKTPIQVLFDFHPPWRERAKRRESPGLLLRPAAFDGFAAGMLVGFSYLPFAQATGVIGPRDTALTAWLAGLPFAVLLSGIAGVSLARAMWGARFQGMAEPRSHTMAAALACGVLAGQSFPLTDTPLTAWSDVLRHHPVVGLCWAVVLFLLLWAFCSWQVLLTEAWIGAGLVRWSAGTAYLILSGGAVLGVWIGFWFHGLQQLRALDDPWEGLGVNGLLLIIDTRFVLVVLAAALLPLAPPAVVRLLGRRPAFGPVAAPRAWTIGVAAVLGIGVHLVAGNPLHRDLREEMTALAPQVGSGAVGDGAAVLPLLPVAILAAAVTAAVAVAAAFSARGHWLARHRFPAAVLGAMAGAAVAGPLMFVHLLASFCGWSGAYTCLRAADPPLKSLAGLSLWTLAFALPAALAVVALLQAVTARARPRRRPPSRPSGRVGAAAKAVPAALAWTLAAISVAAAALATGAEQAGPPSRTPPVGLEEVLAGIRPGATSLARACRDVEAEINSGGVHTTVTGSLGLVYAGYTVRYASTDDPVASALARASVAALREGDVPESGAVILSMQRYCAIATAG
ncbi:peptidase M48-like protein [Actinocorallia herbida]|uniref:Peptidase M48-like protein n=1 Tax=Actinocorallia herbida TaxID=58109 RepID=A0A3N1CWR6_9ACTN|nr:M48 family metalloprotease [Actinocorallia herbida]ROO85740.1 peptidase M48-like protein [Actinocorallia herbida]